MVIFEKIIKIIKMIKFINDHLMIILVNFYYLISLIDHDYFLYDFLWIGSILRWIS